MKEKIIIDLCKEDLDNHTRYSDPSGCLLATGIKRVTGSYMVSGNILSWIIDGKTYSTGSLFWSSTYKEAKETILAGGTYRVELIPDGE